VRVEDKEMIISLRGPNTSAAHALRMLIGGHRKPMVIDAIAKHMQSPRGDFYVWRFFPTYWPGSDIRTPESYRAHLQKYLTLNMDFHSVVAERLGISRDEAKRRNFWSLYGGDPRRFAIFPKGAAMKKQKPNNYFVVPNSVGERYEGIGEGHPTLKAAVTDASERTNKDGVERCVLQRVRVIRRKPQPVVVEKVKA
jgi:hypothetical protein